MTSRILTLVLIIIATYLIYFLLRYLFDPRKYEVKVSLMATIVISIAFFAYLINFLIYKMIPFSIEYPLLSDALREVFVSPKSYEEFAIFATLISLLVLLLENHKKVKEKNSIYSKNGCNRLNKKYIELKKDNKLRAKLTCYQQNEIEKLKQQLSEKH